MKLWENLENSTEISFYKSPEKKFDGAVVVFAGGAYAMRAEHEGKGYAEFLNSIGMDAFVVDYRVAPNSFPLPLLDARRAVRFVRANAEKFGVDKNKIAAMGSSAGGHLVAMLSTYTKEIAGEGIDEIDDVDCVPNLQILCYPVILNPKTGYSHVGSYQNLLGDNYERLMEEVDPALNVTERTPKAFIWHTAADAGVNVTNSLLYSKVLHDKGIYSELHVFPDGHHGLGVAKDFPHVAQWTGLLENYLHYIDF